MMKKHLNKAVNKYRDSKRTPIFIGMNGNVPRGTLREGVDMFHVEHWGKHDKKKGNVPRGT